MLSQEIVDQLTRLRREVEVLAHTAHESGVLQAPRPRYPRHLASVSAFSRVQVIAANADMDGWGLALNDDNSVQMAVRIPARFLYGLQIGRVYYVESDGIRYPENGSPELTQPLVDAAHMRMVVDHAARTADEWRAYDQAMIALHQAYAKAQADSANAAIMDTRERGSADSRVADAA